MSDGSWQKLSNILSSIPDYLALIVALVILILFTIGALPTQYVTASILSVLFLLGAALLLRRRNIDKIVDQVQTLGATVQNFDRASSICSKTGLIDLKPRRSEIEISGIHKQIRSAESVFVLSRYLHSFEYTDVKNVFMDCLQNGGHIRILTYSPRGVQLNVKIDPDLDHASAASLICSTIKRLKKFKNSLSLEQQARFEYRVLHDHIIYLWMVGTEDTIFATFHLNNRKGDECPTIVCKPISSELTFGSETELYWQLEEEFRSLWEKADRVDGHICP